MARPFPSQQHQVNNATYPLSRQHQRACMIFILTASNDSGGASVYHTFPEYNHRPDFVNFTSSKTTALQHARC